MQVTESTLAFKQMRKRTKTKVKLALFQIREECGSLQDRLRGIRTAEIIRFAKIIISLFLFLVYGEISINADVRPTTKTLKDLANIQKVRNNVELKLKYWSRD